MTGLRLERRRFLQGGVALAGLAVLTGCGLLPLPSSTPRARRVGYLTENCECGSEAGGGAPSASFLAFRNAMRNLGYEMGTNLELEQRVADVRKADTYV